MAQHLVESPCINHPKSFAGKCTPVNQDHPPLIIGIDPDGSGALAAIQVQAVPQPNAHVVHDADVELHDNPVEIFQGTTRKRR